ncbi:MAG TPA: excinuclease ABC subunit UvrB [Candidatus Nanoarchaeia archaeon]|nr:excinuclease ABC subunit UvrB [Candidatus Nanoarchaeia archaeon]
MKNKKLEGNFKLVSKFSPKGDQPKAIKELTLGLLDKDKNKKQVLLGVTGSGKTFTVANVIEKINKPTLVIAHNKTLAKQLYQEFRELFPNNRVEYFVSYYDYYQPEAYVAATDTYIEKDMAVNAKIEQMRMSATEAVLSRNDTIIVASVSCIFALGNPDEFWNMSQRLSVKQKISREELIKKLLEEQYERQEILIPGTFRVKGDIIDVIPGYSEDILRIELLGNEIERMGFLDKYNMNLKEKLNYYHLFPARHFVADSDITKKAIALIKRELEEELPKISDPLIAHRLKTRVKFDLEMIEELGYCKGIENYSRHFDGRKKGEPPYTLIDYFPDDFLLVIDESHQTIPQTHGMYKGDRSRKQALIDFGFRLPSAFDNRPLKFEEFEKYLDNTIFVSATPAEYEKKVSKKIVEQIIRPTGLIDPVIEIHSIKGQMDHLIGEIGNVVKRKQRALVTTLTKRMAEELSEFLGAKGIKVRYLHSEIETLERDELLRQLRLGKFDVLVGINLLREGIDLPEVSLVAILDADKEGFLRNETSLIQIVGRAARNLDSKVVFYLDKETDSIKKAIKETKRRREIQSEYNRVNKITPTTIIKPISEAQVEMTDVKSIPKSHIPKEISTLTKAMEKAANDLNFEAAIYYRDRVEELKKRIN